MRKKKVLLISVLAAVILLISGVLGVTAFAQDAETPAGTPTTPPSTDTSQDTFAARVAEILGLDTAVVEDAFAQAKRDMQDEAIDRKLAKLVELGRITQEQADEIKEWLESRPDNLPDIFGPRKGMRGHCGFGFGLDRDCRIMQYDRFGKLPGFRPSTAPDSE